MTDRILPYKKIATTTSAICLVKIYVSKIYFKDSVMIFERHSFFSTEKKLNYYGNKIKCKIEQKK